VTAPGLMVMAIILFMGKVWAPTSTWPSAWRLPPGGLPCGAGTDIIVQLGGDAGGALPAWGHRRLSQVRLQLPGRGLPVGRRLLDGFILTWAW
jgi:hypothetical protein